MEEPENEMNQGTWRRDVRIVFWTILAILSIPLVLMPIYRDLKGEYEHRFKDPLPAELTIGEGFLGPYAVIRFAEDVPGPVYLLAINHSRREGRGYWLHDGVKSGRQLNIGGGEGWTWQVDEELLITGSSDHCSILWRFTGASWKRKVLNSREVEALLQRISPYQHREIE